MGFFSFRPRGNMNIARVEEWENTAAILLVYFKFFNPIEYNRGFPVEFFARKGSFLCNDECSRYRQKSKKRKKRKAVMFAALTDCQSVLAKTRNKASCRIMPLDFDRSPKSDLGYSGWVQFPDGEIYVVNYIIDDAYDKAQIRGYSFIPEDFTLTQIR